MAIRPVHNEKALLLSVSRGDAAAFAELFHAYHPPLAEYILHVTDSLPLTEDIIQDVFIKVWMKRAELDALDKFTDWLFILSRNRTLNALRKKANQRVRELDWGSGLLATEQAHFPEDGLEAQGERYRTLIANAVDRLPTQQQKVWRLSRDRHLTYAQIAGELQIAPSTVKSHMQAALQSVRDYVRDHIDPALLAILLTPLIIQ